MKKKVIYGLLIAFFIICSFKLVSILKNKEYYTKLLDEKTNIYVYGISAPRGRILDCNGKVLVDNIGIKTIYYNKIKGITKSKELEIAGLLANVLSVDEATIDELKEYYLINNNDGKYLITDEEYKLFEERKITKEEIDIKKRARITDDMLNYSSKEKTQAHIYSLMNKGYIYSKKKIASNLTEEEYAKIIESKIPGITGELSWDRIYLYGDTLKNIFGRIGSITKETKEYYLTKDYELTDTVGISYLENVYEDYLRGKKAKYKVGSDYTLTLLEEEQKGNDLILSIDIDMQIKTEEILKDKLILAKKYGNTEYFKDSYALVSDPLTGSIKAISGIRLNDDNTFSDISLNNINKSYTIGSAVKGATIAVGYKYNLIEPGKYINDSCVKLLFVPPKCSFKKLGKVNDLTALSNSSNYYQYMIAIKLTGNTYTPNMKLNATKEHFKKYREMLSSFGLGVKTGIDLPNEQTGIIGKTIADDLLLNLSIGQYDTYTPIEVLQYINSVATGKRIKLSLMQEIKNGEETLLENKSEVLNNVDLDKESLDRIKEGMKLVLSEGTGKFYVPQGLNFAGKTGTSESFLDTNNDNIVDTATISSTFTGFYPADNPKFSIVVITPNVSHKNGKTDAFYFGASKITKELVTFLSNNY
ncbi:cell division protein FtsI/penicillin-binding protein 2 [Clostridium sp. CAG:609]|nr:cell division protein FtsI/penicillin-binding protein 2 [Clostridium sp. CAG:609]